LPRQSLRLHWVPSWRSVASHYCPTLATSPGPLLRHPIPRAGAGHQCRSPWTLWTRNIRLPARLRDGGVRLRLRSLALGVSLPNSAAQLREIIARWFDLGPNDSRLPASDL
jgi:hypothetical protein